MIAKTFYQKYVLLLFYYPPEWDLRQYINMSKFLIFGVFSMFLHKKKILNAIKAGFHRMWLICSSLLIAYWVIFHAFCRLLIIFFKIKFLKKILSGIPSVCQTVWTLIRPDESSDLIWV